MGTKQVTMDYALDHAKSDKERVGVLLDVIRGDLKIDLNSSDACIGRYALGHLKAILKKHSLLEKML